MSRRESTIIYDKNHAVQVWNKSGFVENREININITEFHEHFQIKVRDGSDFVFNYTIQIDQRVFETMRNEQSLDINFQELRTNLLDMLEQISLQEMFLKCEIDSSNHSNHLIFYGKSRIKSIIYLTIKLQQTNQKEIFDEMNNTIYDLQTINKTVNSQLNLKQQLIREKDTEINRIMQLNKKLEAKFVEDLQEISCFFNNKLQECSRKLLEKLMKLVQKLLKLIQDVEIVKAEALLKSDSSARLLHSMENLRLESLETSRTINELKRENCTLKSIQFSNEKAMAELTRALQNAERQHQDLEKLKDELERDVKQATKIVAQKQATNEELARDVVQANQMLVNFNHLFDTKNGEIEELKNSNLAKEQLIHEQNQRYHELSAEFEEYRAKFNPENFSKISQELSMANKRIEDVEKLNRETVKLNELLTRKLASGDFVRNYH